MTGAIPGMCVPGVALKAIGFEFAAKAAPIYSTLKSPVPVGALSGPSRFSLGDPFTKYRESEGSRNHQSDMVCYLLFIFMDCSGIVEFYGSVDVQR